MAESPEYHMGRRAARDDIAAGRERDWGYDLMAPLDWLRGYDDQVALVARTEGRRG